LADSRLGTLPPFLFAADALFQVDGDDMRDRAVDGVAYGAKLRDDVPARSALLDHSQNTADLTFGAPEAFDDAFVVRHGGFVLSCGEFFSV